MNRDLALTCGQRDDLRASTRPANPQPRWLTPRTPSQDLHTTVLRPIARTRLNFAHGTGRLSVPEPQLRSDAGGIAGRPRDADAQPRFRADVVEQPGRGAVLTDREIQAAISVVVAVRGATLLAVHDQSGR